jgi:hypothetical protein
LFPTVGASGSVARARSGSGSSTGNSGSRASYAASLDAQWELDLWGRVRRLVEAAQETAQASAADVENTRLSLQSELAIDYLQLRVADAARRVLEDTVAAYERSLVLTQNRYNAGVAARVDVVQGEAQLLGARASLVDIQATRAQLEHAIAALIGKAPADLAVATVETVPGVPDVPAGVPSELLERRPDIAAAERRVAAANAQVGRRDGGHLPDADAERVGRLHRDEPRQLALAAEPGLVARRDARGAAVRCGPARLAARRGHRRLRRDRRGLPADGARAFRDIEDNLALLRILDEECGSRPRRCARRASRCAHAQPVSRRPRGLPQTS